MPENSPNLKKETDMQIQEAQKVPNKINPKRPTPRHTVIKKAKVKEKDTILKEARERNKQVSYKGNPIRVSANFSAATL